MKILGINFGHDASIALFDGGSLVAFEELERTTRLKYHFGLRTEYLTNFLSRLGMTFANVELAALSGTQLWAMAHSDDICVNRGWTGTHAAYCEFYEAWRQERFIDGAIVEPYFAEHIRIQGLDRLSPSPIRVKFDCSFLSGPSCEPAHVLELVNELNHLTTDVQKRVKSNYFCPYSLTMGGVSKPAFYVDHHICHAFYGHYYSGSKDALVCTHDGGFPAFPFVSGGIYLSQEDSGILPIVSHQLALGTIYDAIADAVGVGDAGKLMGLSAYASPSSETVRLVADCLDAFAQANVASPKAGLYVKEMIDFSRIMTVVNALLKLSVKDQSLCGNAMEKFTFSMRDAGLAAQTASNTQFLVQTIFVSMLTRVARTLGDSFSNIQCLNLTGGFALNCPTNSQLQQQCANLNVNPLPAAGDTGLALGASAAVSDFLGIPLDRAIETAGNNAAFPPLSIAPLAIPPSRTERVTRVEIEPSRIPEFIAERLGYGDVLCIHRGRSEVGPRALGHRSIIALAERVENRDRINLAKGREPWRPLAPIVRMEDFHDYFDGTVQMGRFMMFTVRVLNRHIPAVTHVDGTARVQCIDTSDCWLEPALRFLKGAGHQPVIINTSFNCAGEPIVETLDNAINSFLRMRLDFLVTESGIFSSTAASS